MPATDARLSPRQKTDFLRHEKAQCDTGLIFILLGLGSALANSWLAAVACGTLGLGFGLSDLSYAPALT